MNRAVKIVLGTILVVAIAAGSFYGGMVYGQGQAQATFAPPGGDNGAWVTGGPDMPEGMAGNMPGRPGQSGSGSGQGGMLSGQILAIEDGRLTIQDTSGQEIEVNVTDTTLIQKQAEVTIADLQEGEMVMVSGSQGTDGSITARMVQVSSFEGLGMPGGLPFAGPQPGAATDGTNP